MVPHRFSFRHRVEDSAEPSGVLRGLTPPPLAHGDPGSHSRLFGDSIRKASGRVPKRCPHASGTLRAPSSEPGVQPRQREGHRAADGLEPSGTSCRALHGVPTESDALTIEDAWVDGVVVTASRPEVSFPIGGEPAGLVVRGTVRGAVYAGRRAEVEGRVGGTVLARQLYQYRSPSVLVGWLVDAEVAVDDRPLGLVVPFGLGDGAPALAVPVRFHSSRRARDSGRAARPVDPVGSADLGGPAGSR